LSVASDSSSFLDQCDQVVVYGANGWMGRSAIHSISDLLPKVAQDKLLLIGSKPGHLRINNLLFEVFDPELGMNAIRKNAIFFNAAFLRREFLKQMSKEAYLNKNREIIDFASNVIRKKNLYSFINLSSGAARALDKDEFASNVDEYSRLKKESELTYSNLCKEEDIGIVNCRVFTLSGHYINEFENLALSSFITQAITGKRINVLSPQTKRTYIDACELSQVLLTIANTGGVHDIDSGGTLVTMLELAQKTAITLEKFDLEIDVGNESGTEYFGNFEEFNSIAKRLDIPLTGVEDQIRNTFQGINAK